MTQPCEIADVPTIIKGKWWGHRVQVTKITAMYISK